MASKKNPASKKQRARVAMFRKSEREHVKMVRYLLRSGNYVEALKSLGWALQQATAADETLEKDET